MACVVTDFQELQENNKSKISKKLEDTCSIDSLCHSTIFEEIPIDDRENKYGNSDSNPVVMKTLFGYNSEVFAKNLTTDDKNHILIASGNLVSIYDYEYDTHNILQVHKNKILSMSVDALGHFFVTSDMGDDSRIIIWDTLKSLPVHTVYNFNGNGCPFVKLSPCGKYLLTVAEKHSNKETKLLSLWDWIERKPIPDATLEVNTDDYGCLKKIDFSMENCSYLILTTEKEVIFLTYEDNIPSKNTNKQNSYAKEIGRRTKKHICTKKPVVKTNSLMKKDSKSTNSLKQESNINLQKNIFVYKPKDVNKIRNVGSFLDSAYVRGTHLAITGTSSGNIIAWSDIGMKEHFYDTKPQNDELTNNKNFLLQLCLDPYPIQLIYTIESYIVTVNSKGQIGFYNEKLVPVFKIDDIGSNAPVNISFNLTKRSNKYKLSPEEFSEAKNRLFFMKSPVGPEKILVKRKMHKHEKTETSHKRNQDNLNNFVYDAGKHYKRRKIEKWKKVQDLVPCFHNDDQLFDVRDFIMTTSKGDIIYVNITHKNMYEILQNYYQGVSTLDTHPLNEYICFATCYGKVFLLDYNTHLVVKERNLDLNLLFEEGNIDLQNKQLIQTALNITCIKFSPDGRWIFCGTELGYVWLLNGFSLHPEMWVKKSEFPIIKIVCSNNSEYFAFYDKISQLTLYKFIKNDNGRSLKFVLCIQAHTKPMTDVIFASDPESAYIYSIAEDGYMMKYQTVDCPVGDSRKLMDYVIIEEFDIPTCLQTAKHLPNTLLAFNDQLKCRLVDTKTMTILRTVQGPSSGPVHLAQYITMENIDDTFLLFAAKNEIGFMKFPLDGNPFKITCTAAGGSKIVAASVEREGKYAFSLATNENTVMWDINIKSVINFESIGGKGIIPYLLALKADSNCLVVTDMEALFRAAIVLSHGVISNIPKVYENLLPAIEVPNFCRSLGFYPTLKESKDMMYELLNGEDTTISNKKVSFETCLMLFYNHRSKRFSDKRIQKAFENVCKKAKPDLPHNEHYISSESFTDILQSKGEKFTSCQIFNFLRSLVKPLKRDDERVLLMRNKALEDMPEELLENKYFDFIPDVITYDYFKNGMLGLGERNVLE